MPNVIYNALCKSPVQLIYGVHRTPIVVYQPERGAAAPCCSTFGERPPNHDELLSFIVNR